MLQMGVFERACCVETGLYGNNLLVSHSALIIHAEKPFVDKIVMVHFILQMIRHLDGRPTAKRTVQ